MIKPPIPNNEADRLATLRALEVLDTAPDERFDRITRLARQIFGVPIALVSLIDADRQWFKSRVGLETEQTPRDISFCGHAINEDDCMVVGDAQADVRFADNPLVTGDPHVRFYAAYPVSAPNGCTLGTLCLIDTTPRQFSAEEEQILRDLGGTVEQLFSAMALATVDELTGLLNRRGFDMVGKQALDAGRRNRQQVALLVFDLDYFKEINDVLGHAAGDDALRTFARCLRETFRDSDVVARMGGDEFWVLLPDASTAGVPSLLARLDAAVAAQVGGCRFRLSYSVGIASCEAAGADASIAALSGRADAGMYEDKQRKRKVAGPRLNVIR